MMSASKVSAFSTRSQRTRLVARAGTALPSTFSTVKPSGDRVFVKVDKEVAKTASGLILPTKAQKKPNYGVIVALGETSWSKVGDHVLFSQFAGTEVEMGDDWMVLLKEEDVIGILGEDGSVDGLQPASDRVLIKTAVNATQTSGGVLLAGEGEKPTLGLVVAVGPGKKKADSEEINTPNVVAGSTVLYSKYTGTEVEGNDGTLYIIVRETDIVAALE